MAEAATGGVLQKKPEVCHFIKKEILQQAFSCEFCEIFKNTFFYRTPPDNCFYIGQQNPVLAIVFIVNQQFANYILILFQNVTEPGTRYNVPLMNALVLYVGTQAIAYIQSKSGAPSISTITHSSHMDIFQNLAVDLDTEGKTMFNSGANVMSYIIQMKCKCDGANYQLLDFEFFILRYMEPARLNQTVTNIRLIMFLFNQLLRYHLA